MLPAPVATGLVRWKVLTWNSYGWGPWSATVAAVVDVVDATVPAPAPGGPSGPLATRTPTYTWIGIGNATWYQLQITDVLGITREFWYTPAEACATSPCSVTPNIVLAVGPAYWRLRAWRSSGAGPWTTAINFETADAAPGKATLISTTTSVPTTTPSFSWNAVIGTSYYLLRIIDHDNTFSERWYRPSEASCALGSGICSASPNLTVKAGWASWQILTWNGSGYGPWSNASQFVVDVPDSSAGVPQPLSPTGALSVSNATYTWTSVPGAIGYRLSIRNNGGPVREWWYTSAGAGCVTGIECSSADGGAGEWNR